MISMVLALAATLVALAAVVWSGIVRRRALHYRLIVVLFACLGLAIWRAEAFGSTLRFDGAAGTLHTVHMAAVILTFLLVPLLVSSGVRLARAQNGDAAAARQAHRRQATRFVVLVVIAAVLGTWMTVLAHPA